jgi:hypothetical protein
MKLKAMHILVTMIGVIAVSTVVPAANSRMLSRTEARSAIVSGWIFFVGGPRPTNPAVRHRSGTVTVRTDKGRFVARVHATVKHGFRLRLAPGSYELYATIPIFRNGVHGEERSCGIEPKVKLHAGTNSPVILTEGCEIP